MDMDPTIGWMEESIRLSGRIARLMDMEFYFTDFSYCFTFEILLPVIY